MLPYNTRVPADEFVDFVIVRKPQFLDVFQPHYEAL